MVDCVSGSELLSELLTSEPLEKPEPPGRWHPHPLPGPLQLGAEEVARVMCPPLELGSALWRLVADEGGARHQFGERLGAMRRLIAESSLPTPLPFNPPLGPQ